MESNHHGRFHPQGPQPCASTSSATAACGRGILNVRRPGAAPGLKASARIVSLRTSVRTRQRPVHHRQGGNHLDLDLTKRQKEIFDFVRKYADKTGYPPTVREIGK